eukprot:scaffold2.g7068.t1
MGGAVWEQRKAGAPAGGSSRGFESVVETTLCYEVAGCCELKVEGQLSGLEAQRAALLTVLHLHHYHRARRLDAVVSHVVNAFPGLLPAALETRHAAAQAAGRRGAALEMLGFPELLGLCRALKLPVADRVEAGMEGAARRLQAELRRAAEVQRAQRAQRGAWGLKSEAAKLKFVAPEQAAAGSSEAAPARGGARAPAGALPAGVSPEQQLYLEHAAAAAGAAAGGSGGTGKQGQPAPGAAGGSHTEAGDVGAHDVAARMVEAPEWEAWRRDMRDALANWAEAEERCRAQEGQKGEQGQTQEGQQGRPSAKTTAREVHAVRASLKINARTPEELRMRHKLDVSVHGPGLARLRAGAAAPDLLGRYVAEELSTRVEGGAALLRLLSLPEDKAASAVRAQLWRAAAPCQGIRRWECRLWQEGSQGAASSEASGGGGGASSPAAPGGGGAQPPPALTLGGSELELRTLLLALLALEGGAFDGGGAASGWYPTDGRIRVRRLGGRGGGGPHEPRYELRIKPPAVEQGEAEGAARRERQEGSGDGGQPTTAVHVEVGGREMRALMDCLDALCQQVPGLVPAQVPPSAAAATSRGRKVLP